MYNKIRNPLTGRKVNVTSTLGKQILKSYLAINNGGSSQFLPDIGWKEIPILVKEAMDFNTCSEEEAKEMIIIDVIENVSHFRFPKPPVANLLNFNQTKEKIRKQLEKHDWKLHYVIQEYEENPWYPEENPWYPEKNPSYPDIGWKKIPILVKEVMDLNRCSVEEAKEMMLRDVIESVNHFYRDPVAKLLKFNQTKEKIREQLEKHDWELDNVIQKYDENPWYPDTEPITLS
jgi:hypothetical protein